MVDPKDLRFIEYASHHLIDVPGRGQVSSHRFFHDDARIGRTTRCTRRQARMIQSFAHSGDGTGWDAEIENPIARQLHRSFNLFGACFQRDIGVSVLVLPGEIKEMLLKLAPRRFYKGLSGVGDHSFPRNPTKIQIGEGSSTQSDDGELRRQQTVHQQIVEGRNQTTSREVAGASENHERAGLHRNGRLRFRENFKRGCQSTHQSVLPGM